MNEMSRFWNADRYYDDVLDREKNNVWWRVALRYLMFLIFFLFFITAALSSYWIWKDYSASGLQGITWQNFSNRALYRWQEFREGRLGIN